MIIHAYQIMSGDTIITPTYTDGRAVSDVWISEDGTVRVVYDNGKHEWFENKALVARKNHD